MKTCKCCGRDFNHTNFPYNPGILLLDYACSLRCKKELVESYTLVKSEKQKEKDDAWSKRNTHYSDGTEMSEDDKQTVSALNSLLLLAAIGALIAAIAGM